VEADAGQGAAQVESMSDAPIADAATTPPIVGASLAAAAPPAAVAPSGPPGVRETIGGALDLALAANRGVRSASLYVGVLTLLIVGPAAVVLMGMIRDQGGFEATLLLLFGGESYFESPEAGAISMLRFTTLTAVIGSFLIAFEAQILATTVIGGVATGRTMGVRDALRLSRRVFWSVVGAAILVGILEQIVSNLINRVAYGLTRSVDGATIATLLAAAVVVMPFVFYQSGIILGGVGAIESLRRSTRIARARWRLALLVALAASVVSVIELFALGAGLDIVVRVATAIGLGLDGSFVAALATVAVVLACVVALGSLLVTIAALIAAPQVFVFLRMTGYSAGLDRTAVAAEQWDRRTRLVTRPMIALIVFGVIAGIAGILAL
jgi:hypothetical protein